MFTKILIANRGEIAVRIIRACKEMGVSSVAVYSEADRETLHTALADESVCIGPASAADSYLNAERIISAALATGAAAIHPGYGFLSENRDFAELCEKNGIAFIGPSAETMKALSDKAESKALMKRAGLPVIPGTEALSGLPEALQEAERIGYPVMLKARSGGGGRGIRVIRSREELEKAYTTAEAESRAAFGDGALYLEKYIYPARHIEAQILADEEGHVLCLGERDCSVQRNHQKLIEESPSPAVDAAMRERLVELVREAVPKIGYTGAGTLEFLLDSQGNFWFMEMNLRLQVEHGVTEMLTGVDLVKWQIRTAAGIALKPEAGGRDSERLLHRVPHQRPFYGKGHGPSRAGRPLRALRHLSGAGGGDYALLRSAAWQADRPRGHPGGGCAQDEGGSVRAGDRGSGDQSGGAAGPGKRAGIR